MPGRCLLLDVALPGTGNGALCQSRMHPDVEVLHWLLRGLEISDSDLLYAPTSRLARPGVDWSGQVVSTVGQNVRFVSEELAQVKIATSLTPKVE